MKKLIKDYFLIFCSVVAIIAMPLYASAAENDAADATGDGRIFLAVGILAAAIVVVVVMLVLSKKTK